MYDIIIIGSGPAGLTAAIYASRAQLTAVVLEKDYLGSGQIAVSEQVDNYPGLPGIDGYTLGEKFREHAEQLGAKFENVEVDHIKQTAEGFTVFCKEGEPLQSRTILCASGTSYRRLDVPGGTLQGVSYCATCDGAFFKDKTVAVIGGGDVAVEDAIFLARTCKKVYVIHRRDELRAAGVLQDALLALPNVEMVWDTVVDSIEGNEMVSGVKVTNKKAGEAGVITVDGVFIAVGIVPVSALIAGIVETDEAGYIKAGEDGVTSVPGVFAAGDVRTKQLRQIITAAADGANCVTSVEKYLISH